MIAGKKSASDDGARGDPEEHNKRGLFQDLKKKKRKRGLPKQQIRNQKGQRRDYFPRQLPEKWGKKEKRFL